MKVITRVVPEAEEELRETAFGMNQRSQGLVLNLRRHAVTRSPKLNNILTDSRSWKQTERAVITADFY